jgi:hypothetical protein
MFVKPTAPRGVGGVFEDAFRLYRQLGSGAWLLALAFQLVVAVPSLLWQLRIMPVLAGVAAGGMEDALPPLRVPPALWLLTLIAIPLYLIFYLALIAHINGVIDARRMPVRGAIELGVGRLPRALPLAVLIVCIVILGLILLLVPGFYWAGTLSLAMIVLVIEDTGVSRSIARSRTLVAGSWWHAAILISYNFVIASVAYVAVLLITSLVAVVLGANGSATLVISEILGVAVGTLINPLYCAVYVALYYDLKLRKEGAVSAAGAASADRNAERSMV